MKAYSHQNTINSAKKIVETLNELKFSRKTFLSLGDLRRELRSRKCPHFDAIVSYLKRSQELVEKCDGSFYTFKDFHPYHMHNFISIVDGIKCHNNKVKRVGRGIIESSPSCNPNYSTTGMLIANNLSSSVFVKPTSIIYNFSVSKKPSRLALFLLSKVFKLNPLF